jgi:hydrogenase nickel incorporation protein HypB
MDMCTVCGCGEGETRIEGGEGRHHDDGHGHDHPRGHAHEHEHARADGTTYRHAHEHSHPRPHADAAPHGDGHEHGHDHHHAGDLHYGLGPAHAHAPGLSQERMVRIEQDILGKNAAYAADNRRRFRDHGQFAINLVSSPGSGKTTLLVRTIEALAGRLPVVVIEGDQQTSQDADRIRATGAPAIQINTGKGCHLDAHMVGHALDRLAPVDDSLVLIENVGNLVCPAAFDLGEAHKVVILSVTEGEDKPLKYPDMFHAADLLVLNKVDLLPHLDFNVDQCVEFARRIKPGLAVLRVSATTGEGMADWLSWLEAGLERARAARRDEIDLLRKRIAELESRLAGGA